MTHITHQRRAACHTSPDIHTTGCVAQTPSADLPVLYVRVVVPSGHRSAEARGRMLALERNLDTTRWTPAMFESYAGM
jgi:hypothetical protein